VTAVLSNFVSNVPAVLAMRPFVDALPDHRSAWLVIAMASTLAGNFIVLGSVANLIVVEKATARGVPICVGVFQDRWAAHNHHLDAWDALDVAVPMTFASSTTALGTLRSG
jgi:Na+/H+ antiporter NhaD/arsenite permease-like protein